MDKFPETCNLPRPNKTETETLNRPITTNKGESVIIKLPANESSELGWPHRGILPNIQRRTNACPTQTLPKN